MGNTNSVIPKGVDATWKATLALHSNAEFVWLRLLPLHGGTLVRMLPVAQFTRMVETGQKLAMTKAITHALPSDSFAEGGSSAGVVYLQPDLSTTHALPGSHGHRLEILTSIVDEQGAPIPECVRQTLTRLTQNLAQYHGYGVLVGYEIEVIFFRLDSQPDAPPEAGNQWSAITADVREKLPLAEDIIRALLQAQIRTEQFHAESAPGQWEFVLPPQSPLNAADTLIRARDIIAEIARSRGYRATLHPRPFPDHAGTGAHAHLSINPVSFTGKRPHHESFFAGILTHFPAIMACALPLDVSYERVVTGIWSGGEYVSWGWQNRETALRRVRDNRFEIKTVCGTANPYVALAALLAAGLDGLERELPLTGGDCSLAPAEMSEEDRAALGITTKLPSHLDESLEHLERDSCLRTNLGEGIAAAYISVTREWNKHLRSLDPLERRCLLLERY